MDPRLSFLKEYDFCDEKLLIQCNYMFLTKPKKILFFKTNQKAINQTVSARSDAWHKALI